MRQSGCRVHIERIAGALHGYFALGIQHLYVQESFRHINRFLSVERAMNEQGGRQGERETAEPVEKT